jgi:lipoprotein-anchoring transpeptidase ErfK/SrfK
MIGVLHQARRFRRGGVAVATALALLVLASAGSAARGPRLALVWQAPTPRDGAAFTVNADSTLTIELGARSTRGSELVLVGSRTLPRGARVDSAFTIPGTGTFTWTPTAAQAGEHVLTFTAQTHDLPRAHAQPRSFTVYVQLSGTPAPNDSFALSGPGGVSRWAYVNDPVRARVAPSASARFAGRLPAVTPELVPNVTLLLNGKIDERGRYWVRVRLPMLPNGSTGWVPRSALGAFNAIRTRLVIDRTLYTATLYRAGRVIFRSRIGVGKAHWPTPRGEFHIREKLSGFKDPIYGPLAFGLNARSAVLTDWLNGGFIGIHGTNRPEILPGRVSHGCIRMPNRAILRLARLMPMGTPVTIT